MSNKDEVIVVHIGFEIWKKMCETNSNLTTMQAVHLEEIEKLRREVKTLTFENEQLRASPTYEQLAMDNGELIRLGMDMADEIDAGRGLDERPDCVKAWYDFNGAETDPLK